MKKTVLFIAIVISMTKIYSQQYSENKAKEKGFRIGQPMRFCINEELSNVKYVAYKNPIDIHYLKDTDFKPEHLNTPYTALQSFRVATNNEWLAKLQYPVAKMKIPDARVKYLKSKEFKKNYTLKVISELHFTYDSLDYVIMLTYSNYFQNLKQYPLVFVSKDNKWYLHKGSLEILGGFLFFKPEIIELIFKGETFENNEDFKNFKNEYFNDNFYSFLTKRYLTPYFISAPKKPFPSITIGRDTIPLFDKDFEIKPKINFGISRPYSKKSSTLYNYPNPSSRNSLYYAYETVSKYDGTPEEAFVSWEFSQDSEEKLKYGINFYPELIHAFDDLNNKTKDKRETWSIAFFKKIIFYDEDYMYAFFVYEEWFNGKKVGIGNEILRFIDGVWYIDNTSSDNTTKKLYLMITYLDSNALDALFSESISDDTEIADFVSKLKDTKGNIIINELKKNIENYSFIGSPKLASFWKILGKEPWDY